MNENKKKIDKYDIYHWWFIIRWFIIIILFSISIIRISDVKQITTIIFAATFFSVVALNFVFYLQIWQEHFLFTSLLIILEVIFATIVVHITGGIESSFVWIYLVPVITASLSVESEGGIISALIGSMSLLFLIVLYKIGWLIPLDNIDFTQIIPSELSIFLISYTGLFVSVSVLISYMNKVVDKKEEKNIELTDEIENHVEAENSLKNEIEKYQTEENEKEKLLKLSLPVASLGHDLNTPLTVISLNLRKIEKAASKYNSSKLSDTANDITESLNKIKTLLKRIERFKKNELIKNAKKKFSEE